MTTDHLDHLVINALFEMDGAAALFASLGFQLTPRGRHTLGSINHLMMLPGRYLELVGLPLDTDRLRPEVLGSPRGPSGLVPGSDDIVATRERLLAVGLHPADILDFSRPVLLDGVAHDACFRTVRVATEDFAAGRVYWCEHLTPELVWRDEWLVHDNGLCAIDHLAIASIDAPTAARRYAEATGSQAQRDGDRWTVTLADGFRLLIEPAAQDRFTRIGLAFDSLHALADRASHRSDLQWRRDGADHGTLTIPTLELVLDCRAA